MMTSRSAETLLQGSTLIMPDLAILSPFVTFRRLGPSTGIWQVGPRGGTFLWVLALVTVAGYEMLNFN